MVCDASGLAAKLAQRAAAYPRLDCRGIKSYDPPVKSNTGQLRSTGHSHKRSAVPVAETHHQIARVQKDSVTTC